MKRRILFVLVILFCLLLLFFTLFQSDYIKYRELGIPSEESYPENFRARCVWDMAVHGNRLFIGGGDYDANAGPVEIWCWDISEEQWKQSGTVPDEEVSRFCSINDCLTVPGTDPMGDWELGNYYMWRNGAWETLRVIPGGIHNFDMVEFDGAIFAGLGVKEGEYPISCSKDGGATFFPVEMIKNGLPLETRGRQIRVYDLVQLNGVLYAVFYCYDDTDLTYELYRYDGEKFVFDSTWLGKVHQIKYFNNIMGGKAEFKGKLYFTTGYLYAADDMEEILRISFPHSETVYDLFTADGSLYALCGAPSDGGKYRISVWENQSGAENGFRELFAFLYDAPPLSMVRSGNMFYIGMGDYTSPNEKNGMVLRVEWE